MYGIDKVFVSKFNYSPIKPEHSHYKKVPDDDVYTISYSHSWSYNC